MSTVVEAISQLRNFPETTERFAYSSSYDNNHHCHRGGGGIISFPTDILDTPNEYIFYMNVPGLTKSDIQVTVEDGNTLVVKSSGKRKRGDEDPEQGCKYVRLERKPLQKLIRKFKLPENCNVSNITAKCENGVLMVVVEKLTPPSTKSKNVEVAVS